MFKMNSQTILDQIIFQLTPTRTRCELFAVAGDVTEKLTSGLLKPFLSHLQTAEEQLAKGGYSIKLQTPDSSSKASWFTKGTAERFVRFVSSPEVIERVNTIETELVQLEETIRMQILTSSRVEDSLMADSSPISISGEKTFTSSEKPRLLKKMRQGLIDSNDSGDSKSSKKQLLRALDARRLVLQKEQGMAFARAAAAGYELVHLLQLIMFSDCFGASRLREACYNFVALCRKRQIAGFCKGDMEWRDQDLRWAFSNSTCVCILNSMKEVIPMERKREGDSDGLMKATEPVLHDNWKLCTGDGEVELSGVEKGHQSKLPSLHAKLNPSSPICEWSNSTDLYQGWPVSYTTRNNPYASFQSYQYGFSPGSQESFTSIPAMSPIDATGLYQQPMGVLSQPLSETRENLQMSSLHDRKSFPSLRKLQIGHRSTQNRGRMLVQDFKNEESFVHGYEKDSSELTDSSLERSDSLRVASLVSQEEFTSNIAVSDHLRQRRVDSAYSSFNVCCNKRSTRDLADLGSERNRRGSDSSELSSADSLITLRQNKETAHPDRTFALHQHLDNNVQGSERTVISDKSLVDFEQSHEESLGSKSKKRLDFQEAEVQYKQQSSQQESKALDDCFYVCSPSVNCEQRIKPTIESEVQGNQIYDRMSKQAFKVNSKQALKVNSATSQQQDPDDLLMMPKQRKRAPTRNLSDVMNIDIELIKSVEHANLPSLRRTSMNSEPSQERVKKFLDQYNEKREAKIRGEVGSSRRADREGNLKAMREDLENRKLEMARSRKPDRRTLQTEAQLRADKLRLYKADLQKIKKEKEEEERRRLEELKAQRQERIAARSNPAARNNPNSSTPQGRLSSKLPTSNSKPGSIGRLSLQKSRSSMPNSEAASSSRQRTVRSQESESKGTPPGSFVSLSRPVINQIRSTTPSVPRHTVKASIRSQTSLKSPSLKAPQSTKSAVTTRSSSIFSAVFGGSENQRSRTPAPRKSEPFPTSSKDSRSHPNLPSLRGQTSKAGKNVPKSFDDMKRDGKTFLRKGSGSSGRSVQRPNSINTNKVRALDKKPVLRSGSNTSRVKASKLDTNEPKVFEEGDGVLTSQTVGKKTNSSTPPATSSSLLRVSYTARAETKVMNSFKCKPKEADDVQGPIDLVHFDVNTSIPRYLHDKEMVTLSNKSYQPSKAAMDSHQRLPADPTMSPLMLLDRSCTINGDSSSNKQSIIFNTIFPMKTSYPVSTVTSGSVSQPHFKQSSKDQSNGFEKLGQRSMYSQTLEGNKAGEATREVQEGESPSLDEIYNCRSALYEQSRHPPQSAIKP